MIDALATFPQPTNEPVLNYAPGSPERADLKAALKRLGGESPELPHVVAGKELLDGPAFDVRSPHKKAHVLGRAHHGGAEVAKRAVAASLAAAHDWSNLPFEARARIFLKMADLLAGPWRATLNAATMLGQSKTAYQAEIDAACELADFLRWNVHFAARILAEQPISAPGIRNSLDTRPLEGFVLAVTPFNFTAIAGNLPTAPALLGNVVVWKPSETQALAAHHTMALFRAAGLPDGVINLVHGDGAPVSEVCLASPHLAGIHFTGSTRVFQHLWRSVGERITSYRSYPRIVGETGGKDFVFAHPSADVDALAVGLVRGAFEYQGQKCSAASRAYVPASLWPKVRERVLGHIQEIRMGDVADFRVLMGAVIDERSYTRLEGRIEGAKKDAKCKVLVSSLAKDEGWFVGPTLIEIQDPRHALLNDELFGPVLAVYVYDDKDVEGALRLVDGTSPYALTGAIFSQDRAFLVHASQVLRQAAGNLYWNDKPTGAVVGQQPFGGARASGTNDKAGSLYNLLRWTSPRTLKETFVPPTVVGYPSMLAE